MRRIQIYFGVIFTVAGCQAAPAPLGGGLTLDRPGFPRDRASVVKSGSYPDLAAQAPALSVPLEGTAVRGRVLGGMAGFESPLADAIVSASDGRVVKTGADGAFALPGDWPADGGLVVAAAGYAASALAGATGDALDVHLRPTSVVTDAPTAGAAQPFALTGVATRPDGRPAEAVVVTLVDARGAFSAPAITDAAGRFALQVFAPGRAVTDATLLATGAAMVGVRTGVAAGIDENSGELNAPSQPFALVAADREVEVAVDAQAFGTAGNAVLALQVPGGELGLLPDALGKWHTAALPGVRHAFRVDARDRSGATSQIVRSEVSLAESGVTRLTESLLAAPGADLDPALVLNEKLDWRAVAGAGGYTLALAAPGAQGFVWEAFTASPTIALSYQGQVPSGTYALTLTAWDAPGLSPRSLASLPRALRLPAEDPGYRRASRPFKVLL